MTAHLDLAQAKRPGREKQNIKIELPVSMIHSLDEEALRLGVARQAMIQAWIIERLQLQSST